MEEIRTLEVLLVEDNPGDVRIVESHLARIHDMRVNLQKAVTLAAAEKCLKDPSIQAVLLDLGLPDSTGTASVQRMVKAAGDRPVIVLTGFADDQTVAKALEFGSQDYLLKNQSSPELLRKTLLYAVKQRLLLSHLIRDQQYLSHMHEMKDEFLSIVSHELRTPLTSILGYIKILKKQCYDQLSDEHKEYCETICRNADHLLQLINSLLDLSRLDRGVQTAQPAELDVRQEVEYAIKSVTADAKAAKRDIGFDPESQEDVTVFADAKMLNQVLANFLTNAMKYAPPEKPIRVGFRKDFKDGKSGTFLWVKDEGKGVPEDLRERIFDKFYQAEKHLSRQAGGLGLGLAIVKSIMELHQGSVWVESRAGRGATFLVFFPDPAAG